MGEGAESLNWTIFVVILVSFSGKCTEYRYILLIKHKLHLVGEQWLRGRVLDSRQRGRGFEPHRRHCVVVLEQDTFILA